MAALLLARGGARVALVDKAAFPRDKACGDLVGPRGVGLLGDLGLLSGDDPMARRLGDMEVVGPTGRTVLLPSSPGVDFPGFALAIPRRVLDDRLRTAAVAAGAEHVTARAATPLFADESRGRGLPASRLEGFELEGGRGTGRRIRADVVVGADGALSRVAAVSGLVDERAVLWGFALRGYTEVGPELPRIAFFEPVPGRGYPGYAWNFPGPGGSGNVGIGAAGRGHRRFAGRVARDLEAYRATLPGAPPALSGQLGGWLKLGVIGTVPAHGHTLLVGDAAGLVNPLQGEGIAPALVSGRMAADAILTAGPTGAADRYLAALSRRFAGYAAQTAPVTARLLDRPEWTAWLGRVLTAPGIGRALAGAWALYWNDLAEGARPGGRRTGALAASRLAAAATAATREHRGVRRSFDGTQLTAAGPTVRTPARDAPGGQIDPGRADAARSPYDPRPARPSSDRAGTKGGR
jgi:flavin-dependent dehydrogenase